MEITTVISNGTFQESKTNCCKTIATRNNRNAAPSTRETKKKKAPVLWLITPKRSKRYS